MSPLSKAGMSLSVRSGTHWEIGHGMGDDERTRAESYRGAGTD